MVLMIGFEPILPKEADFKSAASTVSPHQQHQAYTATRGFLSTTFWGHRALHHTHVFATAVVRNPLLTEARAAIFISKAIAACKMKIISGPHCATGIITGNEGVSATAILDYSNASVHEWNWPVNLVNLDIYTCGDKPKWGDIAPVFADLDPINLRISILDREFLLSG